MSVFLQFLNPCLFKKIKTQIPSNIKLKASLKPQKYQLTPQQELVDLTALSVRREAEQLYCYLKGKGLGYEEGRTPTGRRLEEQKEEAVIKE